MEPLLILLDPAAWRAVGKVRGWKEKYKHRIDDEKRPSLKCLDCDRKPMVGDGICYGNITDEYQDKMHHFIDCICADKTIEEALQAIE